MSSDRSLLDDTAREEGDYAEDVSDGLPDILLEFAQNPRGFIWAVVLGGLLSLWEEWLGFLVSIWEYMATVPEVAIVDPLLAAGSAFNVITETYVALGETITSTAASAGLFAPLAALIGWTVPTLMLSALLWFLVGLVDTYLPLSDLPLVGGLIDQ